MGNFVLCREHLEENCFEPGTDIAAQLCFGIKLAKKLNQAQFPPFFFEEKTGDYIFFCSQRIALDNYMYM